MKRSTSVGRQSTTDFSGYGVKEGSLVRYQHLMYTKSLGPKRKIGEEERHYEKELERVLRMKYLRVVEENQRSRGMKDQARERMKLKLHRQHVLGRVLREER